MLAQLGLSTTALPELGADHGIDLPGLQTSVALGTLAMERGEDLLSSNIPVFSILI